MQKILSMSPAGRRVLPALAVAALIAALLLTQLPGLRGLAASPKQLPILTICDSASVPVPETWLALGTTISGAFSSTGCPTPEYKFLILAPGSSTWVVKTGYSSSDGFTWNTAGAKLGTWQLGVWVREVGSTSKYQAWGISTITLLVDKCAATNVNASPATPAAAGVSVTISATAVPCLSPIFEFWEMAPGTSTWILVQAYGTFLATFAWDTTGLPRGGYRFAVWAKQFASKAAYESYSMTTYWING